MISKTHLTSNRHAENNVIFADDALSFNEKLINDDLYDAYLT
jgi:hypothetical protein